MMLKFLFLVLLLLGFLNAQTPQIVIDETYLQLTGRLIASGYYNGDSYLDLVFLYNPTTLGLVFGYPDITVLDDWLDNQNRSNGILITTSTGVFTHAYLQGDLNGDSLNDLIIALTNPYRIAVIAGNKTFEFFNNNLDSVVTAIISGWPDTPITALSSGDLDGDGLSDIIVGNAEDNAGSGSITLVYGTSTLAYIDLTFAYIIYPFLVLTGGPQDNLGNALSVGDFNNDGITDFIAGASSSNISSEPSAYLVYGGFNFRVLTTTRSIPITSLSGAISIISSTPSSWTGASVDLSGDFNNDTFNDIVIGAPLAGSGEAYIIWGTSTTLPNPFLLSTLESNVNSGIIISGVYADTSQFGYSIGVGDYDVDGYDDVFIGASSYSSGVNLVGAVFYFNAQELTSDITLGSGSIQFIGQNDLGLLPVLVRDLNLDGTPELLFPSALQNITTVYNISSDQTLPPTPEPTVSPTTAPSGPITNCTPILECWEQPEGQTNLVSIFGYNCLNSAPSVEPVGSPYNRITDAIVIYDQAYVYLPGRRTGIFRAEVDPAVRHVMWTLGEYVLDVDFNEENRCPTNASFSLGVGSQTLTVEQIREALREVVASEIGVDISQVEVNISSAKRQLSSATVTVKGSSGTFNRVSTFTRTALLSPESFEDTLEDVGITESTPPILAPSGVEEVGELAGPPTVAAPTSPPTPPPSPCGGCCNVRNSDRTHNCGICCPCGSSASCRLQSDESVCYCVTAL
eukprot:TRINITY_DN617_c0_g1_i1.p1 TRINITY_DN617_c0_g1~~TRINITY_DN617_c0_g1_i1.p1  ORF type:complete len:741 (+),score=147.62 TRINITY_DN617_c0_g1_i1:70-2292(+)